MNCRDVEPLLLAERDEVLTTEQHAALAGHVASCPACRQRRADLTEALLFLRTDAANVAVPDADDEWLRLRGQLRGGRARPVKRHPLAPVLWFGTPLAAAAAAIALVFLSDRPPPAAPASAASTTARIDAAAVNTTGVQTMVYVDKDSGWLVVWATEADPKGSG